MTSENFVDRYRELIEDPTFSRIVEWKANHSGSKIIGCYPVYTPVELIHAAGMLPVGILGGGNRLEIAYADSRFQSFICSIVKSTLELGLTGKLHFLDGIVFHSICDPARNLASVFQRNFPQMMVEFIHFPQNMVSPHTVKYLSAEYRRIKSAYEGLAGKAVTDEALRQSIRIYNEQRKLIRELYRIRSEKPHNLSTAECYVLNRIGTLLPVEEHIAIVKEAIAAINQRDEKPKDRIRVILEGSFCEQPPLELIEGLEAAGCYLLDDDFLQGWRWFLKDIPLDGEPIQNLARAYLDHSVFSGVKHDLREPKSKHLIDKVRETGANAVIILAAKFCEPALFDYALYRQALEREGIPHLYLEFEEKMWIFDKSRTEVETFVESMLFD
ncbi:MAG: 2-hydroxyacyl-CoA dehydratase [Deltaproteobacteria bacterium]|nr:2-hydroxyacyl-CoA dehydratase [Deltaproteobacteria bacterium]MCZ6449912.1 2-hydroxyacyl-CoA dehydratase [Deltaproteobacteria bacterium]MCZ6561367.1 2-hydroxyacyl-CoA dehydratase [Deltaproteobacteria bacterium]